MYEIRLIQVLDTPTEKHESRGKKNEQERDDDENKDEEEPKQEEDQPDREEESDDEDKGKDDDNEEDECKHDDEGVGVDRVGSGNNEPGENEDGHTANGGDSDEAAKRDQTAKPVQGRTQRASRNTTTTPKAPVT